MRKNSARAKTLLADQGYLIVLVPAHQFLYNEFDKAIGHYRRYNKKMLAAAAPEGTSSPENAGTLIHSVCLHR